MSLTISVRPERSLITGLCCLLGAYLFQVQHYLWVGQAIPGRGVALWALLFVVLGIFVGWRSSYTRWHFFLQAMALSSLPWLHEMLRRSFLPEDGLYGVSIGLLFSAGWMFCAPLRTLLHLDLRQEETLTLGILLRDLLLLAGAFALLPYFGPLPVSATLGALIFFWWYTESATSSHERAWTAWLAFFPSLAWGLMPWSSGVFLSLAGTWPVEVQQIQGKTFYLERDRRVPLYRLTGPGGDIFSADQHRFAEAAIAPWLGRLRGPSRILLVGGEDGGILHELLSTPAIQRVDLFTARAPRLQAFAYHPILRRFHRDAFRDPRVQITHFDTPQALALAFPLQASPRYEAIVLAVDPPTQPTMRSLYSPQFFSRLRKHLSPEGALLVAAGSWNDADEVACVGHALRRVGLRTLPYRASGMDITWTFWWGAQQNHRTTQVRFPQGLRSLRQAMWPGMQSFPRAFDPRRAPRPDCVDALLSSPKQD